MGPTLKKKRGEQDLTTAFHADKCLLWAKIRGTEKKENAHLQNIQMVGDIFKVQLHQVFYTLIIFICPATELGVNYWE